MISLIIPTLNEAATIKRTLADLTDEVKKKYQVELIISDGGSKDDTTEVAVKLGARVVKPKPDEKQNIAIGRNAGAAVARGDIFIFMDADTFPKSWDKLLSAAEQIQQERKVVAATVSVEVSPAERKFKDVIWQNLFNLVFFTENVLGLAMGRGNCQIVRASTFKEVGGYNTKLAAAEDYDLFRRLGRRGKIKIMWYIIVYESPRRFRRQGYLRVVWWWTLNGLNVFFRQRAYSKKWKRVN